MTTPPPGHGDWIICALSQERDKLKAWYPEALLLAANAQGLRGLSLVGRTFVTDRARALLDMSVVQDHVALCALVHHGDTTIYPLTPRELVPSRVLLRMDFTTGVRTVLEAGQVIQVDPATLVDSMLENKVHSVELRLDTAGEYRYRFAYTESEDVWVYTRITSGYPSQSGDDQH